MWGNAYIQVFEYFVQAKWNGGWGGMILLKIDSLQIGDWQDVGVIQRKNK